MSDLFKAFNKILGQRQRATMAYRPQANGSAEGMVQTTTRALKMYVQDLDQPERLTFAISTARDQIQGETPFYMIHGWDPRSTLEAVIPVGALAGMIAIQAGDAIRCKTITNTLENKLTSGYAKISRIELTHIVICCNWIENAKKLAQLWHVPFRVAEKIGGYAVKLEIAGSMYGIFPVVHVSTIKPVRMFPDRPVAHIMESDTDRVKFDETLLPEDSWIQDRDLDEYEVDRISDMRTGKRTRYAGVDMKIRHGWMKQISTAAPYFMSFCETALIVTGLV
ncbi:reverse transcriptase [Phytophthora megakarya]|uniref:Reverse transcriptase n=1 Tax=Phytophthora megakarya TaxID=4795 RepID=A0A225X1H3_9STRA|nr:reverse transcriptase [Phytophthora megakarya]